MAGESTQIAFTIGARRLFTIDRVLDPFAFSLEEALVSAEAALVHSGFQPLPCLEVKALVLLVLMVPIICCFRRLIT